MVCHGELARDRPAPRRLTQFYLLMSLGGVLGGLFNALLAPLLFTSTAEYPLALVFAALLLPRLDDPDGPVARRTRWLDFLLPAGVGLVCLEFFGAAHFPQLASSSALLDRLFGRWPGTTSIRRRRRCGPRHGIGIDLGPAWWPSSATAPPITLGYVLVERPIRFGLGVAAILLVSAVRPRLTTRRSTGVAASSGCSPSSRATTGTAITLAPAVSRQHPPRQAVRRRAAPRCR